MSVAMCFWCETCLLILIGVSMKYADRAKRVRDNSFFPKSLEVSFMLVLSSLDIQFIVNVTVSVC